MTKRDDWTMPQRPVSADDPALADVLRSTRVVDLTLLLAEDLPCTWPGHMWYQHKTFSWFCDRPDPAAKLVNRSGAPYQTRWLALDEHTGTHLDAPSHFVPPPGSSLPHEGEAGQKSVADVPLAQSMGPAVVIDADGAENVPPGTSPPIGPDVIVKWEDRHGSIDPGDVVLFRSGWDRLYRRGGSGGHYGWDVLISGSRAGWPAPTAETIELLHERGVLCVGTDGLSVGAAEDGVPAHLAGLSRSMVFVEALSNLATLPPRGAFFMMLPLKIEGGTGGPGRAIAFVPA